MRRYKSYISTLVLAAIAAGCSPKTSGESSENAEAPKAADAGVVNIYTSRHYDTDLALYTDFTNLNTRIPSYLRHPDGEWFGLSKRARVIIYNKSKGRPENLNRYEDLADEAHKGQICMRSSGNIYNISLLSSMVETSGADAAGKWVKGVVDNFARRPQSNDSGQIEAVASGECGISMVNTYYLARYANSDDPKKREIFENLGVIFPNQNGRGTHVNISGAGVTRHAPNRMRLKVPLFRLLEISKKMIWMFQLLGQINKRRLNCSIQGAGINPATWAAMPHLYLKNPEI